MKANNNRQEAREQYAMKMTQQLLQKIVWVWVFVYAIVGYVLVDIEILTFLEYAVASVGVAFLTKALIMMAETPIYNHYYANYKPTKEDS